MDAHAIFMKQTTTRQNYTELSEIVKRLCDSAEHSCIESSHVLLYTANGKTLKNYIL